MTAALSQHRLLLPGGLENEFFLITDEVVGDGPFAFKMDERAFRFLAQEMISQGAVTVVIDPFSAFNKDKQHLGYPLRKRVKAIDVRKTIHARALRALQPISDEISVDLSSATPLMHSFVSPIVAEFLQADDLARKRVIESAFVLYSSLYHLMLGMKHKVQIDIDLQHTWSAVQRLRSSCRSEDSQTNLSFIVSILRSYSTASVAEIRPPPRLRR